MRYNETFKAQVVAEFKRGGTTAEGLRRKYGIAGKNTVYRWIAADAAPRPAAPPPAVTVSLQEQLEQAQIRIAYLETVLEIERADRAAAMESAKKKSAGKLSGGSAPAGR
jgi:transposase-like protein